MNYTNIVVFAKHGTGLHGLQVLLRRQVPIKAVFVRNNLSHQGWYKEIRSLTTEYGIECCEVDNIRSPQNIARIKQLAPGIIISMFFDQIITQKILDIPRYGIINFHPGLVPDYRGGHVVQWQIINGEPFIGITTHFMDAGVDSGPIIYQSSFPIEGLYYIDIMHKINTEIFRHVDRIAGFLVRSEELVAVPQACNDLPTYKGRKPHQGYIEWAAMPVVTIYNTVRALEYPIFGAFIIVKGQIVKLRSVKRYEVICKQANIPFRPGEIVHVAENELTIGGIDGTITFDSIQDADDNALNPLDLRIEKGYLVEQAGEKTCKDLIGEQPLVDYSEIFKYDLEEIL